MIHVVCNSERPQQKKVVLHDVFMLFRGGIAPLAVRRRDVGRAIPHGQNRD